MPRNAVQHALHTIRKLAPLVDALYPPQCAGCQRSGFVLCPGCLSQVKALPSPFCQRCGTPITPMAPTAPIVQPSQPGICQSCTRFPPYITALRAAYIYEEPLRACIHALKYDGNTRLADPLGLLLARAYARYALAADAIIPVPLHHQRFQQRGYNHAALLAEVCAQRLRIPYFEHLLLRQRDTPSQVGLTYQQRQQNVQDAFLCSPTLAPGRLRGRTILIIDDVCTSGATLEACAPPLFAAGAKAVWGLALAKPV